MSAETIAQALGGVRTGSGWAARCPAHDDSRPSLSLGLGADGRALFHCHAGCDQRTVIDALRRRGLWSAAAAPSSHRSRPPSPPASLVARNHSLAMARWSEARAAAGSPVASYLGIRGITIAPPPTLRFHPNLKHASGLRIPAMIALVTHAVTASPIAIHRTYLSPNGFAKATVSPNKMMLGTTRGGVVLLAETTDTIMIGEGIETSLSVMQATGMPAWAALSASGMRALDLPPQIKSVTLLADGDDAGLRAAEFAAARWTREGRRVRIARAPSGIDFNDLLTCQAEGELEKSA